MKVFKIFLFIASVLLVSNSIVIVRDYIKTPKNIKHFLFKEGEILEGMSTGPSEVTVDFSKQIATGSPLIFGGAHAPNLEHQDAWNKLQEVGVTAIRRDFFIEGELPANITLEDYKNNKNDVQNPATWNLKNIEKTNMIYENAKKREMKVMGILSYAPAWLTHSDTTKGVPKDWDVYEDIVKKTYKLHRDYLDYIEIWNEPDHKTFLDLNGNNLPRDQAYAQIYFHAAKAIREVEREMNDGKKTMIGGIVVSNPIDTGFFERSLKEIITTSEIDFISYHNYQLAEPSWEKYQAILKKLNKKFFPLHLTEWNYNNKDNLASSYKSGDLSITYTGDKFLNFLKMGLKSAYYFALVPLNRAKYENDDQSMGFYIWKNGIAELTPVAKTFRLLSKSMGLGKGESEVFSAEAAFDAVGFVNTFGQHGLALVNDSDGEKYTQVTFTNISKDSIKFGKISLDVYIASADYDGGKPVDRIYLKPDKNNTVSFTLLLPPQSVAGIIQPQKTDWRELIKTYIP